MPTITPNVPPQAPRPLEEPIVEPVDRLTELATCIRDYEGKPGDLNYQLNNPGDCRPSPVGYLPIYGVVEIIDTDTDPRYPYHIGKFAKFKDYETGFLYLKNLIKEKVAHNPNQTLFQFMAAYAPSGDKNSPVAYANYLAHRLGVTVDTPMKLLV